MCAHPVSKASVPTRYRLEQVVAGHYPESMKQITLADICPQPGKFSLKLTGKEYTLRPITIADQAWISERFGKQLQDIFREVRSKEIAQLAYHQMDEQSKAEFEPKDVVIHNEDTGERTNSKIGGWRLFAAQVSGMVEMEGIFKALLHCIGISQPLIDELEAEVKAEELKKKVSQEEALPAGVASSTDSQASTDTPLTRSAG
jgi:hypothetical protein